jgi:hypothetical protein
MKDNLSENPHVRSEQLVRQKNITAKNSIKKYFKYDKKVTTTPLDFQCECSDPNCDKHVKVSIENYEKIHQRKDRFTIIKGHKTPSVEKVVTEEPQFEVVEKDELKP